MEAFDYEKDYKYAKSLINGEVGGIFKGVFYSSNETIPLTLTGFDLSGKDVLSVIGSGDQVIHALSRDVKSIDVFDICPLPKYYLYLRKWFIKYNNEFYPDFDCFTSKLDKLEKLILRVECDSEQEQSALMFWKSFIVEKFEFCKMFSFPFVRKENIISDIEKLDRFINLYGFESYVFDLCGDAELPSKQYDIVLASNIIEHCGMDNRRIRFAKENLAKLLKSGGIVICSQLFSDNFDPPRIIQQDIFSDEFIYGDTMAKLNIDGVEHDFYAGHSYTKK